MTRLNKHTVRNADEALERIKAKLPTKRRSDAVLCIEYLVGASPEAAAIKTQDAYKKYFADALGWLKDRHGDENVIAASIHVDEKTPHLVVYVTPLDEKGGLNAKKYLGGKKVLSEMQTDFATKVGAAHGLERGIERSTARHTSIQEWYGLMGQSVAPIEIPADAVAPKVIKKKLLGRDEVETPEQVAQRLTDSIREVVGPIAVKAKEGQLHARRAAEIRDQVAYMQRRLKDSEAALARSRAEEERLRWMYEVLTPSQQKSLVQQAKKNDAIRERCKKLLSDAYATVTGSVARFVVRAKKALLDVDGRWWQVKWAEVEEAYRQMELEHTDHHRAVAVMIGHSPGMANLSDEQSRKALDDAKLLDAQVAQAKDMAISLVERSQEAPPQKKNAFSRPRG